MCGICAVNLENGFCFESHKRNYKKLTYIQLVLGIITAVGIVLCVVSHFGYIDRVFVKIGMGSVSSYVISIMVLYLRRHTLDNAIQATTSFDELKEILQESKIRQNDFIAPCICMCIFPLNPTASTYSKVLGGRMDTDKLYLKIKRLEQYTQKKSQEDRQYIEKFFAGQSEWLDGDDGFYNRKGEVKKG